MVKIDETKNFLIIYLVAIIPCCKLSPKKSYNLNEIEKIRIYVHSTPNPTVGFGKLYYINCKIYSKNGGEEYLFSNVEYDENTFDRYVSFFKKYFETEVETIETAKK